MPDEGPKLRRETIEHYLETIYYIVHEGEVGGIGEDGRTLFITAGRSVYRTPGPETTLRMVRPDRPR